MSEIKVGDLVMVVGGSHKFSYGFLGKVGIVIRPCYVYEDNFDLDPPSICPDGKEMSFHKSDLKKINPPSEGETTEAYRNMKEPS